MLTAAGSENAFAAALGAIYAAASEPDVWPTALSASADAIGCSGGMVTQHHFGSGESWAKVSRLDEDRTAHYLEHYTRNPFAIGIIGLPAGSVVVASTLADMRAVKRSAFGADILIPERLLDIVQIRNSTLTSEVSAGGFGFMFREGETFDAAAVQRVQRLAPHLNRAVDLGLHVVAARRHAAVAGGLLEAMPTAAVLLDASLAVVALNGTASRLFAERTDLRLDRGRLVATAPAVAATLSAALARAAGGGAPAVGSALQLNGRDGALVVLVTPLPAGPTAALLDPRGAPLVLVRLVDPARPAGLRGDHIGELFGLTAAELRTALVIGRGNGVPAAAKALGVSVNTVRTHLARIFGKTGSRTQAELAALVQALSA